MNSSPHILLINPWITDFAAYNFWIKPFGLLSIASLLRRHGCRVTLIDCLDPPKSRKQYGDGKFFKTRIEKPGPVRGILPRNYSQYGIPEETLIRSLASIDPPDVIGFTSGMTYWYPGLFKGLRIAKEVFKKTPVLLGGIYATLCAEHARRFSGADVILEGGGEKETLRVVSEIIGSELSVKADSPFNDYPSFDLYPRLDFVCIRTVRGCPLRCTYCASHFLYPDFYRRSPEEVVQEIENWTTRYRIQNIAFYDDALLINPRDHIMPILRQIKTRGIACYFHAPNGLHIREIEEELALLLHETGFQTIRLGLETTDERTQVETGGKVRNQEFIKAVKHLKKAGYQGEDIGVYILVGLPGQRAEEADESIALVEETGARPILVEYSPIPHTVLFEKAKQVSPFDIEQEPLYHNNSILPCRWTGFTPNDYRRLKGRVRRIEKR